MVLDSDVFALAYAVRLFPPDDGLKKVDVQAQAGSEFSSHHNAVTVASVPHYRFTYCAIMLPRCFLRHLGGDQMRQGGAILEHVPRGHLRGWGCEHVYE